MQTRTLDEACEAGEPLIDLEIYIVEGMDPLFVTDYFNSLGPDMEFKTGHWYGDPLARIGWITAEGFYRIFGVKIRRVKHPSLDLYMWDTSQELPIPASLAHMIISYGYGQPGSTDEGQFYEPQFPEGDWVPPNY